MGKNSDTWYVYMVRCSDGTLYTGITNDLKKRIAAHNSGKDGAKYTRGRQPVELVYAERAGTKSAAAGLEHRIKKLKRAQKMRLALDQQVHAPRPLCIKSTV